MYLDKLQINKEATVVSIKANDVALRKHILDMGITPGVSVELIKVAPLGDPIEIKVRGYSLTLRKEDASKIEIKDIREPNKDVTLHTPHKSFKHPKVGENANFYKLNSHTNEALKFVLVGNQNSGKTTLFNELTGSNQHVGNFPGVTVDSKDGVILKHENVTITDLPGIYSISPYTNEEAVTRDFIINTKPDCIIDIVDATNIERNLYLTLELIELNIPMVIALNMMDEVRINGGTIDINELEYLLGVPVIPISASKGEGIHELVDHAINVASNKILPAKLDFCDGDAVHRAIHATTHLIEDHCLETSIPKRFAATKLLENDHLVLEKLHLSNNEKELLEHIIKQMEEESNLDSMSAIANMRFNFIENLCLNTVIKPHESKERLRSIKIDKILTGKYTAIPSFIIIMSLVFYLTFGLIGTYLSDLMEMLISFLSSKVDILLTSLDINPVVHSLVVDAIFNGVGAVLSFLPIIIVLFFFLSILEDTGYMARVAFVMDKLLRKIGLSGRSFVPMLIGFGCSVPAIMSTRILPSDRDRKMTILLTPFMSCSAKLPVYALFTAAFFKEHQALVMIALYFIGIILGIIFAFLLKDTAFKGEPVPFVMELPNYRLPSAKSVFMLIKDKAMDFITKAFTIIFIATIVIWFLETFDLHFNVVSDQSESILASIGTFLSFIFTPIGIGDWRISTAFITGIIAKESVVSTLTVLFGGDVMMIKEIFTTFTAFIFLLFSLLYTPCIATLNTIKRELGLKYMFLVTFGQFLIAWVICFIVYNIGILLF